MKQCKNCSEEFPEEELNEVLLCEECAEETEEADEVLGPLEEE